MTIQKHCKIGMVMVFWTAGKATMYLANDRTVENFSHLFPLILVHVCVNGLHLFQSCLHGHTCRCFVSYVMLHVPFPYFFAIIRRVQKWCSTALPIIRLICFHRPCIMCLATASESGVWHTVPGGWQQSTGEKVHRLYTCACMYVYVHFTGPLAAWC